MIRLEIYNRPGKSLSEENLKKLHGEILSVARESLDEIPHYQCLTGERKEYSRVIISLARNENGKVLGFCSSYILEVGKEKVLHLGLTCVSPEARGLGLTHKLSSKVVKFYLLRYSLLKAAWISNVACVLSSLGNVALHFENVYPSPFKKMPSKKQKEIAQFISENYRFELYINRGAEFCDKSFVFRESVTGTMFEKSADDKNFFHRDSELNQFYRTRINFERGDEILQIGKVSLLSIPKYFIKKTAKMLLNLQFLTKCRVKNRANFNFRNYLS